jgi:hypothetical protein
VQITLDDTKLPTVANTAISAHQQLHVRVVLNGDLVRDASCNAVDANHLPLWLDSSPGYRTGDGIAGGLFDGWFQIPLREVKAGGGGHIEGFGQTHPAAEDKTQPEGEAQPAHSS